MGERVKPFFLTGMPRSRTAWMANWLTTDTTICYHDPKPGSKLADYFAQNPNKRVGWSGPEVCTVFEEHKDAPWVIVARETSEALPAFASIATQHGLTLQQINDFWFERLTLLGTMAEQPNVIWVNFHDLNLIETARRLWGHLLPELLFDAERWAMLNDLHITQDIPGRKAKEWPLVP
jgi:hypothetical protein